MASQRWRGRDVEQLVIIFKLQVEVILHFQCHFTWADISFRIFKSGSPANCGIMVVTTDIQLGGSGLEYYYYLTNFHSRSLGKDVPNLSSKVSRTRHF